MILAFLTSFTLGCSRTVEIKQPPPIRVVCGDPQLLIPTPLPSKPPQTTEGLIDYMLALDEKLKQCNADKRAFQSILDEMMVFPK